MTSLAYYFRRFAATTPALGLIGLGAALTGYTASLSWEHTAMAMGPLIAVSAGVSLAYAEFLRGFHRVALVVLGLAAAALSGNLAYDRVLHGIEQKAKVARDHNSNVAAAAAALAAAEAKQREATDTVKSEASKKGCARNCRELLQAQVTAANAAVTAAQAAVKAAGAPVPVAGTAPREIIVAGGLPIWLELAAPFFVAGGISMLRRRRERTLAQKVGGWLQAVADVKAEVKMDRRKAPTKTKAKGKKGKAKPAAPVAPATRPILRLVAANDR